MRLYNNSGSEMVHHSANEQLQALTYARLAWVRNAEAFARRVWCFCCVARGEGRGCFQLARLPPSDQHCIHGTPLLWKLNFESVGVRVGNINIQVLAHAHVRVHVQQHCSYIFHAMRIGASKMCRMRSNKQVTTWIHITKIPSM